MTATCWHPPLPAVARLGFDRGWLVLAPTFLNLGLPTLLVDHRLVGDANLNLEPFADHRPGKNWQEANSSIRIYWDGTIGLWQTSPEELITTQLRPTGWNDLAGHNQCLLVVGETYHVQLTWSALWRCAIGLCDLRNTGDLPSSANSRTPILPGIVAGTV